MGFINDGRAATEFDSSADARDTLGALFTGSDGIYQYVVAGEAVEAGEWVIVDEAGEINYLNTTDSGALPQAVGIAVSDIALGEYGYVWRGCGVYEAFVTNGATAAQLTTTATDGVAGAGGDNIIGARNVDTGVTDTRTTIFAATIMATNT